MCNSVMQTSIARLGGVCGSVNSCKQRGTGWPAFFLGKICYMMGFLWFKITIIQLWLQICHGHFKLGTSCNVTHCDLNYLRLLCGSAKSFLLFRVDHVNLWRVEGRQALGDLDKLLSSMLAPDVKRWSQAILWRRALLSLGVASSRRPLLHYEESITVPPNDHAIWLWIDYISYAFIFLMSCSETTVRVK